MKKGILGFLSCLAIFIFAGCENNSEIKEEKQEEEKIMSCTFYQKDVINNYQLNSAYKVYYKGDFVNKIETTETVTSNDDSKIEYFEESLNNTYKSMSDAYGGYNYTVTKEEGKITFITTVNYNEVNLEQLAKDNPTTKLLLNEENKITLEKVKSVYSAMGIECED